MQAALGAVKRARIRPRFNGLKLRILLGVSGLIGGVCAISLPIYINPVENVFILLAGVCWIVQIKVSAALRSATPTPWAALWTSHGNVGATRGCADAARP